MLLEVELRDFAIVRQAKVGLTGGLCVLSGETGAGKSIVIDAIALLLGARSSAEWVRSGADSCRLRATFDLSDVPGADALLQSLGLEPDPDGICPITRDIGADGRSRCTINGATATVTMLRALGERLLDLHGQHEHQSLLRVPEHLRLLDSIGGAKVAEVLAGYQHTYHAWRELLAAIDRFSLDESEKARRADTLRFQIEEIEAAGLTAGEEDELAVERERLGHAEKLLASAAKAHEALAEADENPTAVDRVAAALDYVREMAEVDATLQPLADELDSALAVLSEAARTVQGYADAIDLDPRRLDNVEERLALIDRLRRKYGETTADILAFGAQAQADLDAIQRSDEELARLQRRQTELATELAARATALTKSRKAAGQGLQQAVQRHLADLGMAAATFEVAIEPSDNRYGPTGADAVEFLISANPGEPPKPLAKIASGGEISRVMLALKTTLAESDAVPTMIFDEIDVGIGGVTIHAVGQKMAAIAARRQVICITHHAPIAALADCHIAIAKSAAAEGTELSITRLEGEGKVYELARMLGRQPPTEATLAMARELLASV